MESGWPHSTSAVLTTNSMNTVIMAQKKAAQGGTIPHHEKTSKSVRRRLHRGRHGHHTTSREDKQVSQKKAACHTQDIGPTPGQRS